MRRQLMKTLVPTTVLMVGLGYPGEVADSTSTKVIFWVLAMIPFVHILYTLYGQLQLGRLLPRNVIRDSFIV